MKRSLIVVALVLALFAGLAVIAFRPSDSASAHNADVGSGPSFEVSVVKPLASRPLYRILTFSKGADLRFDHRSPGTSTVSVAEDHLELTADGWRLFIAIDGDGGIKPETHVVFSMDLGGIRTLRCRPADPAVGEWVSTSLASPKEFSGRFSIELAVCEDAGTAKVLNWPPAPLTVVGSFHRLSTPQPAGL